MYRSQRLALKYFTAAIALFGVMTLAGLMSAYYYVNLRGTYQVNDNVQIFGLINNVTDHHYATFGTFFGTDTTGGYVNQTLFNNNPDNGLVAVGNAQAVTVAQPISVYAGVRVTF